jgi:hypothetical protein
MFGLKRVRVLEAVQGLGDIARHGEANAAGAVIPDEGEAKILGVRPIGGDGVQGLETLEEM